MTRIIQILFNPLTNSIGVGERLNDHEIAAMIQAADEDGNGEIDFLGE